MHGQQACRQPEGCCWAVLTSALRNVQLRRKQFAHLSMVLQNLTASIRERAEPADDGGTMDVDS